MYRIITILCVFILANSQVRIESFNAFDLIQKSYLDKIEIKYDSQLNSNIYLKIKKNSLTNSEVTLIADFFNKKDKFLTLKKLRANENLHDFVFYYAALERYKTKEYYKSRYNLKKTNQLGIYNKNLIELNKNLAKSNYGLALVKRIGNITFRKAEIQNDWELKTYLIENKNIVNINEQFAQFLNENIIYISPLMFLLIVFLGYKLIKSKEAFIEEFSSTEDSYNEIITTEGNESIRSEANFEKFNEILEKARKPDDSLENKIQMAENSLSKLEKRMREENFIVEDKNYSTSTAINSDYNINKIQFNSGELELAMNLQNIKKRTDLHRSKYQKIKPMLEIKKSNNEIAKELGLSINEIEMYLSFSSAS